MNDIEKRARELLAAEYEKGRFRAYGPEIRNGTTGATWDEEVRTIIAALTIREGELLAGGPVNLLDQQHSGVVVAQVLDVVPSAALGADEAGAVGVGGQSDQSLGIQLAEVASEHGVGVQAASDSGVTANLTPPDGYVLVPVELTHEMYCAFVEQWFTKVRPIDDTGMEDCYAAMLAARPEVSP